MTADLSRLVYLVSRTETIYEAGVPCVYSDGNAAVFITKFCDDPAMLATHVDLPLMTETMWKSTWRILTACGAAWPSSWSTSDCLWRWWQASPCITRRCAAPSFRSRRTLGADIETAIRPGWYF